MFCQKDVEDMTAFVRLYSEAQWQNVTPEKAVAIYKATAFLAKIEKEIKCSVQTQIEVTSSTTDTQAESLASEQHKSKQK
jgi:hypothetical protein